MNKIFVYGTLMSGHGNNFYLAGKTFTKALLYGYRRIWPKYAHFPVIEMSKCHNVEGELYEVNDATLKRLDKLEGIPNFYRRIKVFLVVDNKIEDAWTYYPSDRLLAQWKAQEKEEKLQKQKPLDNSIYAETVIFAESSEIYYIDDDDTEEIEFTDDNEDGLTDDDLVIEDDEF